MPRKLVHQAGNKNTETAKTCAAPLTPNKELGGIARKYDTEFVERLRKIHATGNESKEHQKTGERRQYLFEKLQITDEQFTASYDCIRDALRKEVGMLLRALKKDIGSLRTLEPTFITTVDEQLQEGRGPFYVAELKKYYALLVREIQAQEKDPEKIKRGGNKGEEEKLRQQYLLMMRDIELGLQLQAFHSEKAKKIEDVLTANVSEHATSLQTLMQIRKEVSAALQEVMQKKHEHALDDPVTTMDAFYAEIDMERRSEQEKQLPQKILNFFGRGGNKKPCYSKEELMSLRNQFEKHLTKDRLEWALGVLSSQKKIAILPGATSAEMILCRDPSHLTYTPQELESILPSHLYDQLGKFVYMGVATNPQQKIDTRYLQENDAILGIPSEIAEQMMASYEQAGCVKKREGTGDKPSVYLLDENVCLGRAPSSAMLARMQHVKNLAARAVESQKDLATTLTKEIGDLAAIPEKFMEKLRIKYEKYDKERTVKKITVPFAKKPVVMHFSNMQLGHACFDMEFMDQFRQFLEEKVLPKKDSEHLPTVIVISASKHGDYTYQKKNRQRLSVAPIHEQYEAEKEFNDWCIALKEKFGITIIYNLGQEDELAIGHYAVDTALRIMSLERQRERAEQYARRSDRSTGAVNQASEPNPAGIMNWKQVDQICQTSLYTYLFKFWWDVAYPYSSKVGHELDFEEFLLLEEAYNDLVAGRTLRPEVTSVIKIENIPLPNRNLEDEAIIFTDDYIATLQMDTTEGGADSSYDKPVKEIVLRGSRSVRGTESSASKDPLDSLRDRLGHMHAKRNIRNRVNKSQRIDDKPPDVWGTFDQNLLSAEMVGGDHGSLIYSTPTLRRGRMDLSSFAKIQDDNLWRALFNRKDPVTPGVMALRFSQDGRFSYDIYNETLMALSEVSKHRAAIFLTSDWQVGSITSRKDYLIKMLTMFWHDIAAKYPEVYALANGDEYHGYNYIMAGQEGEPFGLPQIRDQSRWITRSQQNILSCVPKKNKSNVKAWHITNGNHEDNKALMNYGTSHQHPLEVVLDLMSEGTYETYYHDYEYSRARKGVVYKGSMMTEKVAGHNIFARHYLLERFGKGSGGNPANQGRDLLASQAMQMALVDFLLFSHFHNHRMICVGDKPVIGNLAAADPSYYESMRAYLDAIGCTMIYLGGGLPATVEVVTKKALDNYKMPKEAFYGDENKNMNGFETDSGWDPDEDGLINAFTEKGKSSALQKKIADEMWAIKTRISQGYPDVE
ncbi:hypothetical protein A3D11_01290 [Candidatus Peribacteria bacterium RIFCSPHIGHO2_02_FULL_49_16]|nr:MAG: hypothetical protein A2880_02415 [Candidatus Peribacteria bacterium RIFCSPHIGHO2_01_FULL_49_38]OGJ59582.1 MAG: hypothetical protein A3D11_01290 [Candidatus Peribacteria bacterium RIFCSPHIGHO2_02_FULL_49_16]